MSSRIFDHEHRREVKKLQAKIDLLTVENQLLREAISPGRQAPLEYYIEVARHLREETCQLIVDVPR